MFKLILNLFSDVAGAIFFILKIVVVGIGKVLGFLVDSIASSDVNNETNKDSETGIRLSRIDSTSYVYDDRFISMRDD